MKGQLGARPRSEAQGESGTQFGGKKHGTVNDAAYRTASKQCNNLKEYASHKMVVKDIEISQCRDGNEIAILCRH